MPTTRSIRRALALVPALFLLAGCGENNEGRINTQGTTTAPEAVTSTEDALKKGAEPAKPETPSSYPGAGRRR